ncbi:hypothetical protein [Agrobacterium genomosp. 13]|uniref:hypothetical protein n=1 Tax=Agrobacterium genomosp. 13 TaxID=1183419 RepID=UPI00142D5472|nr:MULTISPECIES: hypothetical protein [Agrobacterium tumefaciens complex]
MSLKGWRARIPAHFTVAFLFLFAGKPHKQPAMSQYRLMFKNQIGRIIGPAFRPL